MSQGQAKLGIWDKMKSLEDESERSEDESRRTEDKAKKTSILKRLLENPVICVGVGFALVLPLTAWDISEWTVKTVGNYCVETTKHQYYRWKGFAHTRRRINWLLSHYERI